MILTTIIIDPRSCFVFLLIDGVRDLQSPPDSVIDQNEMQRCFCWTRVARITDVTFLVLYIITIIVFLSVLGKLWVVESY